jgi:hypothetical protein
MILYLGEAGTKKVIRLKEIGDPLVRHKWVWYPSDCRQAYRHW